MSGDNPTHISLTGEKSHKFSIVSEEGGREFEKKKTNQAKSAEQAT